MELFHTLRQAWCRCRGWCPVAMAGETYRCDVENMPFWDKVSAGRWEPQTLVVLDRLLTPEARYCDIGAWIGPTVLNAARKCQQVYCLEPDPVAYGHLLQNLQLNRLENVLPFHLALAAEAGLRRMASPRGNGGIP